jgi:hypothetical protein
MSLTDYSDLAREIEDVPDMEVLPNNSEVTIRIVKIDPGVVDKEEKDTFGAKYMMVTFDVPDEATCPMFSHFMWDLESKDVLNEKQFMGALREFRSFANTFGLDYTRPFSWDELIGAEGDAVLKVIKDKNGEYPDKNGIKRFVEPR